MVGYITINITVHIHLAGKNEMIMELRISKEKYRLLVETVAKKIVEEEINNSESDFEPGVIIPTERIDYLQSFITRRITKKLIILIRKKELYQPEYVWRKSSYDPGLYVRKRKDSDQMTIPSQYLNVKKLVPNLRSIIENEINKILRAKRNYNKCP